MKTVKAAIIGGGWFGQFHMDNLKAMPGVEVIAAATGNRERLAALSRKAPAAHLYSDQQALVENEPELDALIACVPPDSHNGIEFLAAEHHVALYMEKPLGISMREILRCEKAVNESGIVCAVGYQTRYNPHLEDIRTFLRGKKVGAVTAKWLGVMPPTPWWRIKERSGGQLVEQVTHMIDLLRFLFGEIDSVYSRALSGLETALPGSTVEDSSATVLLFKSGLPVTLTCGCFVNGEKADSEIKIEIYTDQGRAEYVWDANISFSDKQEQRTLCFGNEFHFPALQTFIEAVRTGDQSLIRSPYSDAVRTFTATLAANRSMETHMEIRCDDLHENPESMGQPPK